jgi:hypothetical protein
VSGAEKPDLSDRVEGAVVALRRGVLRSVFYDLPIDTREALEELRAALSEERGRTWQAWMLASASEDLCQVMTRSGFSAIAEMVAEAAGKGVKLEGGPVFAALMRFAEPAETLLTNPSDRAGLVGEMVSRLAELQRVIKERDQQRAAAEVATP